VVRDGEIRSSRETMTINADTSALAGEDSAVRAVFGELSKAWATGPQDPA
jgi:hypothetical protein